MHLGLKQLGVFFAQHSASQPLVLATVVATTGSTYRKRGALMLLAADGSYAGLISGGCLEDDLAGHAVEVFADGQARRVDYDLNDDPELVWGLGLGCGGSVHVLLSRLDAGSGLDVMQAFFATLEAGHDAGLAVVYESAAGSLASGSLAVHSQQRDSSGHLLLCAALASEDFSTARSVEVELSLHDGEARALMIGATATPHVLVCGAGPDAVPLATQVLALGWACSVVDHRPAYARETRFPAGTQVYCQRPEKLTELALQPVTAAVVMSHHVGHDASYLRQLAALAPAYIGLLGPAARRRTLLATLGEQAPVVHGPAGLDIGAELPESIALSIVAEIHARLNGRNGQALSDGASQASGEAETDSSMAAAAHA
jgi:xanthine dehydrogenase accessory factor